MKRLSSLSIAIALFAILYIATQAHGPTPVDATVTYNPPPPVQVHVTVNTR